MISRSYTWNDENATHSEEECARARALATRWSALATAEEERRFRRQAEMEDRWDPGPEPCEECAACERGDLSECEHILQIAKQERELQAERDLEMEIVEEMLTRIGARMMRPYEHWNEDERLMEYLENRPE